MAALISLEQVVIKMRMIFLSDGEMMLWEDGRVSALHSERKTLYIRTTRNLEERNAWKYEGAGAKFQGQANPYERMSRMADTVCELRAVAPWQDQLLYALCTPEMGGLYLKPLDDDDAPESNWLSERGFQPVDLQVQGEQVVLAADMGAGERHIVLMKGGSSRYEVITQGDTQDSAPFLCPGGRTIYYASAGWARDENGHPIAKGPSAVLRLDLRSGDLTEVAASEEFDYLRPRQGPDGALYVIRRSRKADGPRRLGLVDRAKNIGAAFKGLGTLLRFIGDPEGAARRTPRVAGQSAEASQKRMLDGMLLEISAAGKNNAEEEAGVVPSDWVLLRQSPDGAFEEVCKAVADYDFDGDALVCTDGRRIFRLSEGRKTVLHKAVFIPRVVIMK